MENTKIQQLGLLAADIFSDFVGSWRFASLYTIGVVGWIELHRAHLLAIDTPGFTQLELFLCYLAGIQAPILLMAQNHRDRQRHQLQERTHRVAKRSADQIDDINRSLALLEEIVGDLAQETHDDE